MVDGRERASELVKVQSIADDEVGTFEAPELDVDTGFLVGSFEHHHNVDAFRFELLEGSY